jgi:hypothetical protein
VKLLILTLETRGDVQPFVALPEDSPTRDTRPCWPHHIGSRVSCGTRAYRSPGSTTAGPSPPKGRAPARTSWSTTVRWSSASMSRRSWDPGRAGVADTHVGADSRVSLGGHSDTALVALGAEPGHLSRGEGPGDDVRPHRRPVARRWTCRDAVAGRIRAAAPTAHRRRCCTRSADMAADWPDAATVTGCWFLADTEHEQSPLPAP